MKVDMLWLRGLDLNQGPLGYEPNELPDCSTPQLDINNPHAQGQTTQRSSATRESSKNNSLGSAIKPTIGPAQAAASCISPPARRVEVGPHQVSLQCMFSLIL